VTPGAVAAAPGTAAAALAPLRAWLAEWQARVRAVDYAGGRALCAPEVFGFGTP